MIGCELDHVALSGESRSNLSLLDSTFMPSDSPLKFCGPRALDLESYGLNFQVFLKAEEPSMRLARSQHRQQR